jgi:hypothetical protein
MLLPLLLEVDLELLLLVHGQLWSNMDTINMLNKLKEYMEPSKASQRLLLKNAPKLKLEQFISRH